jgi:hypothetical protein
MGEIHMRLLALILFTYGSLAQAQMPGSLEKAKDLVAKNPNCSKQVIESLKKESTITCAKSLKPGTPDKKKALEEKCSQLKGELTAAQAACITH